MERKELSTICLSSEDFSSDATSVCEWANGANIINMTLAPFESILRTLDFMHKNHNTAIRI
jgi:hypothetical protein